MYAGGLRSMIEMRPVLDDEGGQDSEVRASGVATEAEAVLTEDAFCRLCRQPVPTRSGPDGADAG
jgi:hypothetical protein